MHRCVVRKVACSPKEKDCARAHNAERKPKATGPADRRLRPDPWRAPRSRVASIWLAGLTVILLAELSLVLAADSTASAGPSTERAAVPVIMQFSPAELDAVKRGDRKFSPVVAEYLAVREAALRQSWKIPRDSMSVTVDEAIRLVKLGFIRRIVSGEGLVVYLFGVSGRAYRATQEHDLQVLTAANAVDPAGLFILRVEH